MNSYCLTVGPLPLVVSGIIGRAADKVMTLDRLAVRLCIWFSWLGSWCAISEKE